MEPLKISVHNMVAAAIARITEITAKDALNLIEDKNVVIVDIRDIRERHKLGYMPGSYHAPRGMLEFWIDPQSLYFKDIFGSDKKFIFHCAAGWRSALSVATLNDMGFKAAHISDGFAGWLEAGGPVERSAPNNR
jgi:rhodanese-related sulfurtransferase